MVSAVHNAMVRYVQGGQSRDTTAALSLQGQTTARVRLDPQGLGTACGIWQRTARVRLDPQGLGTACGIWQRTVVIHSDSVRHVVFGREQLLSIGTRYGMWYLAENSCYPQGLGTACDIWQRTVVIHRDSVRKVTLGRRQRTCGLGLSTGIWHFMRWWKDISESQKKVRSSSACSQPSPGRRR